MALNDVTINFDLHQILGGDFDTRRTKAYIKTNVENGTLQDTSTGETRLGDQAVTINDDGTGSFTTWGVGADGNPVSWQTTLVVDYPRTGQRDRQTRSFGPYTLADANDGDNITDLEDEQAIPAEYQTAFTDAARAYLDAQAAIAGIDDTDSAVAGLIKDKLVGPLTNAALDARSKRVFGVGAATGNDWTKINVQIAAASAAGGGTVALQPGQTYTISAPLELPAHVVLDLNKSTLTIANGANCDVVRSADFDDLTGHNYWLVSEGVPVGFGVVNGVIDGNSDNNTSGYGLRVFGKRYQLDNLIICNTAEVGWYTECGAKGGQEDTDDLPENNVGQVWIRNTGDEGAIIRGPHDARIGALLVAVTGGIGVHFQTSGTYEGACDVGFMHVYASQTGAGVVADTEVHIEHLRTESHYAQGLIANGLVRIGLLDVFNNQITYASALYAPQANTHVELNHQDCEIGLVKITAYYGGTGLKITAAAKIAAAVIGGGGTGNTGIGVDIDASTVSGNFDVRGFDGTGGIGIRIQKTSGVGYCNVRGTVDNCKLGLTSTTHVGDNNRWDFQINTASGQTAHDITETIKAATRTVWSVSSSGAGTISSFYRNNLTNTPQVDAYTSTGNSTWTKPDGAVHVDGFVFSAGGGGASGATKPVGTGAGGGGGGGGGMFGYRSFVASELGSTENVTVGAGGAGGAAVATTGTNGNNGSAGGASYFGTSANRWLHVPGGNGGQGGTTGGGAGGNPAGPGGSTGAAGAASAAGASGNSATATGTPWSGPGGGGGGGVSAAEAASAGGIGGVGPSGNATSPPAGGTAPGGNGNAGNAARSSSRTPGGSGSGGAGGVSVSGGTGGAGASPCGGGGGGGGARDGQSSGAGGAGGDGMVVIITYFA